MGQKVHPTGFRLGISTEYTSKWYAGSKDYSSYLLEDYRIREYLKKQFDHIDSKLSQPKILEPNVKNRFGKINFQHIANTKESYDKILNLKITD